MDPEFFSGGRGDGEGVRRSLTLKSYMYMIYV
jgi:hypothetical protein